jgi:hypothetical protein
MKNLFCILSMVAFAVSAAPQARADEMSIDFIYDNLSGGNWIDVEGYGYGWQPDVATSDPNWRPYSDGYWAYTDYGWTWISYEDFGWATYHYGRWANLGDYGWVWFPGSDLEWGPAWVSWRTGGDYIGWAPLPPRGPGVVYESQPIGVNVDVVFDIGPEYYNFCDVRFIGEPVLRDRILPPVQNVTYITNTVNVTNITVQNNVVYNYGPDFSVVNTYSSRPIQRLTIERQAPANITTAVKSGTLTKVQGDKLLVAAPQKLAKAAPAAKPPAVKAKVAQPKIEHGWKGVSNRAELEQKIKTENPKNVPPPTRAAARAGSSAPSVGGASPAGVERGPAVPPAARGRGGRVPPGGAAEPSLGNSPSQAERGKGRQGVRPRPEATTAMPQGADRESPAPSRQRGNLSPAPAERGGGRGRPGQRSTEPGPASRSPAAVNGSSPPEFQGARPQPEHTRPAPHNPGEEPNRGQGGSRQVPPQQREREPERQRFGTPAPTGAAGHDQRGTRPSDADRQPVNAPGSSGSAQEARSQRERMQGAHGQPEGQGAESGRPRGPQAGQGAHVQQRPEQPGNGRAGADRGSTQGQPPHGKAKGERETPPPEQR